MLDSHVFLYFCTLKKNKHLVFVDLVWLKENKEKVSWEEEEEEILFPKQVAGMI